MQISGIVLRVMKRNVVSMPTCSCSRLHAPLSDNSVLIRRSSQLLGFPRAVTCC